MLPAGDSGVARVSFSYPDDATYAAQTSADIEDIRTRPGFEFISASTSDPKPGEPRRVVVLLRAIPLPPVPPADTSPKPTAPPQKSGGKNNR